MKSSSRLLARYLKDLPAAELTWIGLRPGHRLPMQTAGHAQAVADFGLEGDHRSRKKAGSGRQVTIISEEFIRQIAQFTGHTQIDPTLLRRNLVIRGINLNALRYQQFAIGEAVFEAGALCDPCSRMEEALGKGGFAAMMGHGGLCLKVIKGGAINTGDAVKLIMPEQQALL